MDNKLGLHQLCLYETITVQIQYFLFPNHKINNVIHCSSVAFACNHF